jgi:NhaP-type Na+/H+ or K+/H+ antiporter
VLQIGLIIVLGIVAQWVAWRLRMPSILLLLLLGVASGPGFGWIHPDELLGETLFPFVSLAVALILFEGGLSLRFAELRGTGLAILRLVLLGGLVAWVATAAASYGLLGFDAATSVLLGAVLVVTGPTVVQPLLRTVRPKAKLRTILKWEGIAIDPVGATLALLVYEVLKAAGSRSPWSVALDVIGQTLIAGTLAGMAAALLLMVMMRRFWLPDNLQAPGSLALVVAAFIGANAIQEEAGLFAVTLMGVILANQKWVAMRHIIDFKEHLRTLLISALFILLSSRLTREELSGLGIEVLLFVGAVILVVRPLSVFASTMGTGMSVREQVYVSSLAPRGIVAAAVASLFALKLGDTGDMASLVPVTFATIVGTVLVYGLSARLVARALGFTEADPKGVLFVGAQDWTRQMARLIAAEGFRVVLVDTNYRNVAAARMEGLQAHFGSILAEDIQDELNLEGIGSLLAATSNDEANSLAALHFPEAFGRDETFQLSPDSVDREEDGSFSPRHLRGRFAFRADLTYDTIEERLAAGHVIRRTKLTKEFGMRQLRELHGRELALLFIIDDEVGLTVAAPDLDVDPAAGDRVIYMAPRAQEAKDG